MTRHLTDTEAPPSSGRPRYHHGDLSRHLLWVARDEIAKHGAGSVSLASMARLAQVAQPAPYRHCANCEALLESVAAQGFDELVETLEHAAVDRSPRDALRRIAIAYVTFGQANIELYRLMFASRLTPLAAVPGDLARASDAAFALLRGTVAGIAPPKRCDAHVYRVWAVAWPCYVEGRRRHRKRVEALCRRDLRPRSRRIEGGSYHGTPSATVALRYGRNIPTLCGVRPSFVS